MQALALFVGGNGLKGDDRYLIERELDNFEILKKKGFHQIRSIEEALPDKVNAILTIEGGEAFGDDLSSVQRFRGIRACGLRRWPGTTITCWPTRPSRGPTTG